ncbi:hypothetical protein GCM10027415_05090 [Humibacter ginsengisoli]
MPAFDRDLHRLAQGEPYVALRHTVGERLIRRAVSKAVDHEVAKQSPAVLFAELGRHGPSEFARSHRDSIGDRPGERCPFPVVNGTRKR